jgi:methylase of polypeptide subunit release factors
LDFKFSWFNSLSPSNVSTKKTAEPSFLSSYQSLRILDLCSGSGCISLALFHHLQNNHKLFNSVSVVAADRCVSAIKLANDNLQHYINDKEAKPSINSGVTSSAIENVKFVLCDILQDHVIHNQCNTADSQNTVSNDAQETLTGLETHRNIIHSPTEACGLLDLKSLLRSQSQKLDIRANDQCEEQMFLDHNHNHNHNYHYNHRHGSQHHTTHQTCIQRNRHRRPNSLVDLIVSNPPYVLSNNWQSLQPEITKWEDFRALVPVPVNSVDTRNQSNEANRIIQTHSHIQSSSTLECSNIGMPSPSRKDLLDSLLFYERIISTAHEFLGDDCKSNNIDDHREKNQVAGYASTSLDDQGGKYNEFMPRDSLLDAATLNNTQAATPFIAPRLVLEIGEAEQVDLIVELMRNPLKSRIRYKQVEVYRDSNEQYRFIVGYC